MVWCDVSVATGARRWPPLPGLPERYNPSSIRRLFGSCVRKGMREVTVADRLRYRFDNTISKGTIALIGWLFLVLLALVLTSTLLVYLAGIAPGAGVQKPGFLETFWLDLMRTIDPGNV